MRDGHSLTGAGARRGWFGRPSDVPAEPRDVCCRCWLALVVIVAAVVAPVCCIEPARWTMACEDGDANPPDPPPPLPPLRLRLGTSPSVTLPFLPLISREEVQPCERGCVSSVGMGLLILAPSPWLAFEGLRATYHCVCCFNLSFCDRSAVSVGQARERSGSAFTL